MPRHPVVEAIAVGILLVVAAGLVYVGVVVWNQEHWPTVTGRTVSCSPNYSTSTSKYGSSATRVTGQSCQVTWQSDGRTRYGELPPIAGHPRFGVDGW